MKFKGMLTNAVTTCVVLVLCSTFAEGAAQLNYDVSYISGALPVSIFIGYPASIDAVPVFNTDPLRIFIADEQKDYMTILGSIAMNDMNIEVGFLLLHWYTDADSITLHTTGYYNYTQASSQVPEVAQLVVDLIDTIMNSNVNVDLANIHLIGSGLSAHVAGLVGQKVPGIGFISGLDPTALYYEDAPVEERLDSGDAGYVAVFHSTDPVNSIETPLGHVDYYLVFEDNYPTDRATPHLMNCNNAALAYVYTMAFLVSDTEVAYAYQCDNDRKFKRGRCFNNAMAPLVPYTDTTITGSYYFEAQNFNRSFEMGFIYDFMFDTPVCFHTNPTEPGLSFNYQVDLLARPVIVEVWTVGPRDQAVMDLQIKGIDSTFSTPYKTVLDSRQTTAGKVKSYINIPFNVPTTDPLSVTLIYRNKLPYGDHTLNLTRVVLGVMENGVVASSFVACDVTLTILQPQELILADGRTC